MWYVDVKKYFKVFIYIIYSSNGNVQFDLKPENFERNNESYNTETT